MEPHSLRFVTCPKCHQLLVEYPSIPVYKCGGCGTVLRGTNCSRPIYFYVYLGGNKLISICCCVTDTAKHQAAPAARAGSESGEHSTGGSRCSLNGSPSQSSGPICSGEQGAVSSVDQPHEATAHGSLSSTANKIDSGDATVHQRTMSAADSGVTHAKHPKDMCSLPNDGDIQNSGVMVKEKEVHHKDAGAIFYYLDF